MTHFFPLSIPIVAIVCVFAYKIAKLYRTEPAAFPGDKSNATDMIAAMERMEERIGTLERILDAEAPQWRETSPDPWRTRA